MVQNFVSENNTKVRNQYVIFDEEGTHFQSYYSLICTIGYNDKVHLSRHWNYSRTTTKYLCQFLRRYTPYKVCGKNDIIKLIDDGTFIVDLIIYNSKYAS